MSLVVGIAGLTSGLASNLHTFLFLFLVSLERCRID